MARKKVVVEIDSPFGETKKVPVTGADAEIVLASPKFQEWLKRVDTKSIDIRDIAVGSTLIVKGALLFAWLDISAFRVDGTPIPGVIFLGGNAAAVLAIIEDKNTHILYTLITKQLRLASGEVGFPEIPAGIIDEAGIQGVAAKTAARELGEEATIFFKHEHLVFLDWFYTSVGRTEERVHIFFARLKMNTAEINAFRGKMSGLVVEHEQIVLDIIPLDDLPAVCSHDSKSLAAYAYYTRYCRSSKSNWA